MVRDIFTNKWILGGLGFLIIFTGLCYLWYQWTTAPYREQVAELNERVRQSEKQRTASAAKRTEPAADASAESNTPNAEKQKSESTAEVENNTVAETQQPSNTPVANVEAKDMPMSPFGFGPYPEVPEDMPGKHLYTWPTSSAEAELLSRVLIKLWTEGERNFRGGSTHKGKIQPHYHDTVYVTFGEYERHGETIRFVASTKSGPHVRYTEADLLNPPPHLRVLDLETSGIDPYQYLDLPYKKKGEK